MSDELLIQYLDHLPVSAGAVRLLVALISKGAVETEMAFSNLELGRMAFSNEAEPLGDQALKKRTLKFVQELEKARVLQVTAVKVGKGHGRNKYQVMLDLDLHRDRQEVRETPKSPPRGVERTRGTERWMPIALPAKNRKLTLTPQLREWLEQNKKS